MKLTVDLNRVLAPAIAMSGLLYACSVQPDSPAFAISLSLTVSGLLLALDDVHERGLRRDRRVVAHLAKATDGARVRQIGNALDLPDRAVANSLARLAADGLAVLEAEGESLPMRSYRISG